MNINIQGQYMVLLEKNNNFCIVDLTDELFRTIYEDKLNINSGIFYLEY